MFMITTTYLLRSSNPNSYLTFSICLLVYMILFFLPYFYWKIEKFFKWTLIASSFCLVTNMIVMFLPGNENFLTANLVVLGVSNAFTWAMLGSVMIHKICEKKRRKNRYLDFD